MKKIAIAFLCVAVFLSCSTTKKNVHRSESKTDSTAAVSIVEKKASSKDSTAVTASNEKAGKQTDSTYKKKTTVKELFSDEFDFEVVLTEKIIPVQGVPRTDTAKRKKLLYRETTIEETGQVKKEENSHAEKTAAVQTHASDSGEKKNNSLTEVKKQSKATDKEKDSTSYLGAIIFWLGLILFLYLIYRLYKRFA